ncbi:vesicle transport protein SEC20-like [Oppia nitens]|uniref:vesicle transport protein SEC20-like n=1 Tax=Oppia nitens TaxID=1686743 RepID=UPI0023DC3417|nr:vesicle transport protein SEC20-like [Oppia nitens]
MVSQVMAMETALHIKTYKDNIIKSDLQLKALINDISKCNTCEEDINYLISRASQLIRSYKTSIDDLIKTSKELSTVSQKKSLDTEIDGFRNQLEANSISLRKAIAGSQKCISTKTREQLFNINTEQTSLRHRNVGSVNRELLANKSNAITDNLKSVSRLLAAQVTQSEQTLHTLIDSSAMVTETGEEFKSMSNLIVHSRKLLTKYGRREITDKVLIILALIFFFGCVLYVMTKRLFWRYY